MRGNAARVLLLALCAGAGMAQKTGTFANAEAPTVGRGSWVEETESIVCPMNPVFSRSETTFDKITAVVFKNTGDEPVMLYWVNFEGVEINGSVIAPGATVKHNTRFGHVFRVRNQWGRVILEHKAGMIPIRNDALVYTESPDPPPDHKPKQRANYHRKPTGYVVGWTNKAGFYLDLYHHREGHTRDLIGQMRAGAFFFEYTYHNHEFLAKTPDNRVVALRKMSDVEVFDCPERVPCGLGVKILPKGAIDVTEKYGVCLGGEAQAEDDGENRTCGDANATMEYETFENKVRMQKTCNVVEIVKEPENFQFTDKVKVLRDVFVGGLAANGVSVAGSVLA